MLKRILMSYTRAFLFSICLLSYGKAKNNETYLNLYQDESVDYVILGVHLF